MKKIKHRRGQSQFKPLGLSFTLLDEITANLDAETEARVLEALRRASEGRTVLSISHRIYENLGGRTVEIKPYNAYAADSAADCSVKAV